MNSPKIGSQQNYGMIDDYTLEFANDPSNDMDCQHFSCIEQQEIEPRTAIVDRFESASSDFYVPEQQYMGFVPDGDFQNIGSSSNDIQMASYASMPDEFSNIVDTFEEPECSFQLRDILESVPQSHLHSNLATSTEQTDKKQCSIPYVAEQDFSIYDGLYNPLIGKMQSLTQQRNLLLSPTCGNTSANTTSMGVPPVISSKTRIRWTPALHEKFVECVKCLGGSERATPKAILNLMNSDGLTIYHIKSHLGKYRMVKRMPAESVKRTSMADLPLLDVRTHLQMKEALQLQLDVQKQLHDQLEVQKNLQMRLEEQSKQLKVMFEQQQISSASSSGKFKAPEDTD